MSVTADILCSWRTPRKVVRRLAQAGQREDRALAYLMIGCLLIFVAQWPRLARVAAQNPLPDEGDYGPLAPLMAYELFAWLILWPLAFYALAALLHLVLRLFRRPGPAFSVRLPLFWAVLASAPAALLFGLSRGIVGDGIAHLGTQIVGLVWLIGLVWIAGAGIAELRGQGRGADGN